MGQHTCSTYNHRLITHKAIFCGVPTCREQGSEIPPRRAGVPPYSPVASAAEPAEPAPQDRPRQGLLSVRDILWGVFVFSVAALVLLVLGTLAVGGGQQVNTAMAVGACCFNMCRALDSVCWLLCAQ